MLFIGEPVPPVACRDCSRLFGVFGSCLITIDAPVRQGPAGRALAQGYRLPRLAAMAANDVGPYAVLSRHAGELQLVVYCSDRSENVLGESCNRMDLKFTADGYARAIREGIQQTVRVPLKGRS